MPDDDSLLAQGTVDFRQAERDHANGRERRSYPLVGGDNDQRPPDYDRVVAGLTDSDLNVELELGRGDVGYRDALARERDRRER